MRKTKIVCTIGPASETEEVLIGLCKAGMNVARLNFSHGTYEYHKEVLDTIKEVRKNLEMPVATLLDTRGPEIRLGMFKCDCTELIKDSEFTLTTNDVEGDCSIASITLKTLPKQHLLMPFTMR